ncbi:MAG: helix-turn-helix domain-containing protein [Clostridia bacterium]|nr:helix-turn-helix domain-containing protein [Clostridia bacterium]
MSSEHKPTLRVLSVLDLVAHHSYKYTFTEISHVLDIPASTLFPIIHTLREQQYLSFDERTQTYALGIKLFELGSMIQNTDYFSEIIDVMHTVVDGCGETCHFGVLSGGDVLYLAKVDSPHAIRMYSMAGRRLPRLYNGDWQSATKGLYSCATSYAIPQWTGFIYAKHDNEF